MYRNLTLLWLIALLLGTSLAQPANTHSKQTLTGIVSDAMCGAKHMMEGSPAECTRACVKQGSNYALVVGDKVYTLSGHSEELDKLAGQKATVTGTVHDDGTVDVASVK